MRLSLAGSNPAHRKFAAARASFLAWSNKTDDSRLVTTARTRDQQASRAFAAELLAPAKFLKQRLGKRGDVSPFVLDKLSDEMGISPTVVRYQARNNGYFISEAA
jgi:Zn-dependent peptidase ImmA (M78 family)